MTPEGKVKQWLQNQIDKRYGHLAVWKYAPPGGYFGQNGTADRLLAIESGTLELRPLYEQFGPPPGVLAAIEVKAEGNHPTPLQLSKLREISGGVAAVLIGKDPAKVAAIFAEIDKRREMCRLGWQIMTGQHTRDGSLSTTRSSP
jgi:hypothetical protein